MTKQIIKNVYLIAVSLPVCLLIIVIVYVNAKLYYHPTIDQVYGVEINQDLYEELKCLRNAIEAGADDEMQAQFPEGYVFMNALYGLAWCNFIDGIPSNQSIFRQGHQQVAEAYARVSSLKARSTFDESLPLPYGAFYFGWSTYLLGKKLMLEDSVQRDSVEVALFKNRCVKLSQVLKTEVYPASYYNGVWPADVSVCVASFMLHDKMFRSNYDYDAALWLSKVKQQVDSSSMIPHSVHPVEKSINESARGSSQSLQLIFLHDIDSVYARGQFNLYKNNFADTVFGVVGMREYISGGNGYGDIDSGPLFFDLGSAATIVGMATCSKFGDNQLAVALRNEVEAFGFPVASSSGRKYLFGKMPIADAFIAWSHSLQKSSDVTVSFWSIHIYSGFVVAALLILLWIVWRKSQAHRGMFITWGPDEE